MTSTFFSINKYFKEIFLENVIIFGISLVYFLIFKMLTVWDSKNIWNIKDISENILFFIFIKYIWWPFKDVREILHLRYLA